MKAIRGVFVLVLALALPAPALDVSAFHHVRINHSELFADEHNHISGVAVGVLASKIRGAALIWVRLFAFRDAREDSK